MDGVTLVFNKTYYWEAAEIEYLCSNESSNLASNSNGLELRDRRHRSGNDMSERHQGVDESFWFVSNEWDSRKKGHWLRGMRRGRVLCATSFVCLSKAICVHSLPGAEERFPFKPSFSCTLSASGRPALPAAALASRYTVRCSCSSNIVESVRGDNDSCDKAAPSSCQESGHPVGLFPHMVVISEGTVCVSWYRW